MAGNYTISNLVNSGSPTIPSAPSTQCTSSPCSASQLATYDTWYWLSNQLGTLPGGCGAVATALDASNNTIVTVTVQWDDSPAQSSLGTNSTDVSNGSTFARFVVGSVI